MSLKPFLGLLLINIGSGTLVPGLIYAFDSLKNPFSWRFKTLLIFNILVFSPIAFSAGISMAFHAPFWALIFALEVMKLLEPICWESFLLGLIIVAAATVSGPHKEPGEVSPKRGYQILYRALIIAGAWFVVCSLVPNPF